MATIVIVCLVVLGAGLLVAGLVFYIAIRKAPHGVEDDEGFHRTDKPER